MSTETEYEQAGREFDERVSRMRGLLARLVVDEGLLSGAEQIALACALLDCATFIVSKLGPADSWRDFLREALESNINNEAARASAHDLFQRLAVASRQ